MALNGLMVAVEFGHQRVQFAEFQGDNLHLYLTVVPAGK